MRGPALLAVFLSITVAFATDLASSYQQAVSIAAAQEIAANTKPYVSTVLLPYYAETYAPVLQSCFKLIANPESGPFSFVAALGKDGHVLHIFNNKQTNISRCLLTKLERGVFPAPPESPFYFHVDMGFEDEEQKAQSRQDVPPLVLKDNKYSYTFGVPRDWEFSFEQAHARGADLAFFPKGGDFNNSTAVIYANEVDPSCEVECLSAPAESIAKTLREVKADSPNVEISTGESVRTKDGGTASIRLLKGSQDPRTPQFRDNEALAFLGHEETTILVVLTSRNPKTWDQDYAAFRQVVAGHKFFTCTSPDLVVPCKN